MGQQVGVIVVDDNVNTQAFIDLLKQDKKLTIGSTLVADDGTKYIPIDKNG